MKRSLTTTILGLALSGLLLSVAADAQPTPDRLRAEAMELRHKAEALESEGKLDQARELAERAERMVREAEGPAQRRRPERERREAAEQRERAERERAERERAERERWERERAERPRREMIERRELPERQHERVAELLEQRRGEMVERIGSLEREIAQLRERGREIDTEPHEREIQQQRQILEMIEERIAALRKPPPGPPPGEEIHRRLAELRERIGDLHRAGQHEEAERLQREAHGLEERLERMEVSPPGPRPGPGVELERRIDLAGEAVRQMHEAAEKLHGAGFHEQAEQLHQAAERVAAEIDKRVEGQALQRVVDELREEVGRLRGELDELRRHVEELSRR